MIQSGEKDRCVQVTCSHYAILHKHGGVWHLQWVLEPTVPDLETAASHLILPVTLRGGTLMVGTFQLGEARL